MANAFTEEQRACVERLAGPVDISAGAGSGKTFTLTQRIAAALADPYSGVDDMDQICAITFTRKAAAELKGRVRSTLRARGLLDQAMKVDGAWISTINGMCSRIVRAEALSLGVDPAFAVIEGTERDALLAQAISTVLGNQSEIVEGMVGDTLLREYPVRSYNKEASITSMIEALVDAAASQIDGFDGLVRGPAPARPSALARTLLEAYDAVEPFYQDCNASKTRNKALADLSEAREMLQAFLASGSQDATEFLAQLNRCAMLPKINSKNEARSEAFDAYQACHSRVAQNAALAYGSALLDELIAVARRVDGEFVCLKRALGVLDNHDLVRLALKALDDPAIGTRYADRFRLVMVDEFQDTDALQIAIVKRLSGAGLRYLCTVGDAQQSIYRFRGADVNGYRAFRAQLDTPEVRESGGQPTLLHLTKNFRSHADVLAFVKRVCSQPFVFGDEFLDLQATYDGRGYRASEPRVQLTAVLLSPGRRVKGEIDHARAASAREVAAYFLRMRQAGHSPSEMVLLLPIMEHAAVFAAALREAGLECIVAGGSMFFKFAEVKVMRALASAVVNPEDTTALFAVLTSDMFRLSADDLLTLATGEDETWQVPQNRKLNRGLTVLRDEIVADAGDVSPALRQAVEVLTKAVCAVRFCGLSKALEGALIDSGWLARLQCDGAEGGAVAANILKAVRLVEELEEGGAVGPSSVQAKLSDLFDQEARNRPGLLNAENDNAVRIMSIHSSKGLQFPLVAVAEINPPRQEGGAFELQSRAGCTCVSLAPGSATLKKGSKLKAAFDKAKEKVWNDEELMWQNALDASDAAMFHAALRQVDASEELAERQRLFYVAITRAKEAAAVFLTVKPKKDTGACSGIADDIRSALLGEGAFPEDDCALEYGGSKPAAYRCVKLFGSNVSESGEGNAGEEPLDAAKSATAQDALSGVTCKALGEMSAPAVAPFSLPSFQAAGRSDTGLFSYSMLSHAISAAGAWEDEPAAEDQERKEVQSLKDVDSATGFGSVFHRMAELAVLQGGSQALAKSQVVARSYGVSDLGRLNAAFSRWTASRVFARTQGYAYREPEFPFTVDVAGTALEGQIDLLCFDKAGQGDALIVDYKTGGSPDETADQLQEKHRLQGKCYALAALRAGFSGAEVVFVRVEQDDPSKADTLQSVAYRYGASDADGLEAEIAALRSNFINPTQTGAV